MSLDVNYFLFFFPALIISIHLSRRRKEERAKIASCGSCPNLNEEEEEGEGEEEEEEVREPLGTRQSCQVLKNG